MNIDFKILILLIIFIFSTMSCSSSTSLNTRLSTREQLNGEKVDVVGVVSRYGDSFLLCEFKGSSSCVNLQYNSTQKEKFAALLDQNVRVNGVYLEHRYFETDANMAFIPSRISVTNVIKRSH